MRPDAEPVRWIGATLLAAAVLACLLAAAERWLWRGADPPPTAPAGAGGRPLVLLPPPRQIEPIAALPPNQRRTPRREPVPDEPPWWEWAWRARAGTAAAHDLAAPMPAAPDSAPLLLARLGVAPDLLARARPDSVLAARLAWLTLREGYLPAAIRPWLRALGRAESYRAVAAQAAVLYDEFLAQEIITTD